MNNEEFARPSALDDIGGESLLGSGFEEEIPDTEFPPYADALENGER